MPRRRSVVVGRASSRVVMCRTLCTKITPHRGHAYCSRNCPPRLVLHRHAVQVTGSGRGSTTAWKPGRCRSPDDGHRRSNTSTTAATSSMFDAVRARWVSSPSIGESLLSVLGRWAGGRSGHSPVHNDTQRMPPDGAVSTWSRIMVVTVAKRWDNELSGSSYAPCH